MSADAWKPIVGGNVAQPVTPSPTEDGAQTARAKLIEVSMFAEAQCSTHEFIARVDALIRAVEHRVRAEGVAQRYKDSATKPCGCIAEPVRECVVPTASEYAALLSLRDGGE